MFMKLIASSLAICILCLGYCPLFWFYFNLSNISLLFTVHFIPPTLMSFSVCNSRGSGMLKFEFLSKCICWVKILSVQGLIELY